MNKEQPSITMSVVVRDDFSWVLQVQGRTFDPLSLPTLPAVWPTLLCSAMKVHNLLKLLGSLRICPGIPDEKFGPIAQSRKGKFLDHSGKYTEAAMYPMFLCVYIHCLQSLLVLNSLYSEASGLSGASSSTIRTTGCTVVFTGSGSQCSCCTKFRAILKFDVA